jgi:hypothetical protein
MSYGSTCLNHRNEHASEDDAIMCGAATVIDEHKPVAKLQAGGCVSREQAKLATKIIKWAGGILQEHKAKITGARCEEPVQTEANEGREGGANGTLDLGEKPEDQLRKSLLECLAYLGGVEAFLRELGDAEAERQCGLAFVALGPVLRKYAKQDNLRVIRWEAELGQRPDIGSNHKDHKDRRGGGTGTAHTKDAQGTRNGNGGPSIRELARKHQVRSEGLGYVLCRTAMPGSPTSSGKERYRGDVGGWTPDPAKVTPFTTAREARERGNAGDLVMPLKKAQRRALQTANLR